MHAIFEPMFVFNVKKIPILNHFLNLIVKNITLIDNV